MAYAAVFWATVAAFVSFYEEPTLSERYGEQYCVYRRAVRRWWPRRHPGAATTQHAFDGAPQLTLSPAG